MAVIKDEESWWAYSESNTSRKVKLSLLVVYIPWTWLMYGRWDLTKEFSVYWQNSHKKINIHKLSVGLTKRHTTRKLQRCEDTPKDSINKSNETPTWCNTVQVLFLQSHSTCFGRKRPSSGVFKTSTADTVTCVIVAGKSSHLLIRAGIQFWP